VRSGAGHLGFDTEQRADALKQPEAAGQSEYQHEPWAVEAEIGENQSYRPEYCDGERGAQCENPQPSRLAPIAHAAPA
jgi:hypothetical protein